MMKKLSVLLVFVLLLSLALGACGEKKATIQEPESELEFVLNDAGTAYTVVGMGSEKDSDVCIPGTYRGLPVTAIGKLAFSNCWIKSISIPDSITSIGDLAFMHCLELESILIPSSVTSIGTAIFSGHSDLKKIEVDAKNTVYHAAGNCLIETKSKTLIMGCQTSVIPDDGSVTFIGEEAFSGCDIASVTIPKGINYIGQKAFFMCGDLTDVKILDSDVAIEDCAFGHCGSLTSVDLPDGPEEINSRVFENCVGLTDITIPGSVQVIRENAFEGCGLTNITFQGTKSQWEKMIKKSGWDSYTGPYTVHCTDGDIPKSNS